MNSRTLSAAALKWIALTSMLIDHAAEVLYTASVKAHARLFGPKIYLALRCFGRLAFPIYAFLLAEGFYHTRSRGKYLLRLGVFALLSELPFDLAFRGVWLEWEHQNVFCTLFLGLAALWLFTAITGGTAQDCEWWRTALGLLAVAALAALAELGHTDYGVWGVSVVASMGILRTEPRRRNLVSGALLLGSSPLEAFSFVDYWLFSLYNGQRGRQCKYLFYVFYPGHLLLLCLLRKLCYT